MIQTNSHVFVTVATRSWQMDETLELMKNEYYKFMENVNLRRFQ